MRVAQPEGTRGSLKWMQRAVAWRPDVLQPGALPPLDWVSPLAWDDFAEYRDAAFLARLGLDGLAPALAAFWPRRGPQWDGLARFDGGVVLAEAKAHLAEFDSPASAAGATSAAQIAAAFAKVQADLQHGPAVLDSEFAVSETSSPAVSVGVMPVPEKSDPSLKGLREPASATPRQTAASPGVADPPAAHPIPPGHAPLSRQTTMAAPQGKHPPDPPRWDRVYYQYANRLAHLWFLRAQGVDAHLLLIGFLGDTERGGPSDAEDWHAAYSRADAALGLPRRHALTPFIHHLSPDTAVLTTPASGDGFA